MNTNTTNDTANDPDTAQSAQSPRLQGDARVTALLEEAAALFPSPEGGDRIAEANARKTLLA